MFANVVDAYRRGKSEDVYMIPVSIAYEQIQDVGDYVAEQRGAAKQAESFRWFLGLVRRLRHNLGDIHIRFGEPLPLAKYLGPPSPGAEPNPDEQHISVQKVAFEVAVRINRVTPITPTSLVTMALLGQSDHAVTVPELVKGLKNLVNYVRRRNLPTTEALELDNAAGVQCAVDRLAERRGQRLHRGLDSVYVIGPDQHLIAAYYRNTIIHFFVNASIAELALLRAAEVDAAAAAGEFWEESRRLRDVLKFEFFFADKDIYRDELRGEVALHDAEWESRLDHGSDHPGPLAPEPVGQPAQRKRSDQTNQPGHRQPDTDLHRAEPDHEARNTLPVGRFRCRRIRGPNLSPRCCSVALRLARNRDLVDVGCADLLESAAALAAELRAVIRRIDAIDALAASRLAV